jgi:hypothetical protein
MITQSVSRPGAWARAVFEYSAVKCQPSCAVWGRGSHASPFALNRFGAILMSFPAAARSRYSRSTSNSRSTAGSGITDERAAAHSRKHLGKNAAYHCPAAMTETADLF